jgi:ATP/maltotriose-dependent transcriptional regulator MalT
MEEARDHSERALVYAREVGDRPFEGYTVAKLGVLLFHQGRLREARAALETGEAALREVGFDLELGVVLCDRARVDLALGEPDAASARLTEAESLSERVDAGPDSELGRAIAEVRAAFKLDDPN